MAKSPVKDEIVLQVRAEGGSDLGDMFLSVKSGESALGKTYDEWSAVEAPYVEIKGWNL